MAKDRGGHGSEKRGGSSGMAALANHPGWKGNTGVAAAAKHPGWAAPGAAAKANNATWRSAPPSQIERLFSGGGQPVTSNAHAAATLAQGGAKSAPVDVHPGAAGRSDGPLAGMTGTKWDAMNPAQKNAVRDNSGLSPQLKGLEGHRVQVTDTPGSTPRNFIVGKSTGWVPAHLEIKTSRSSGGGTANKSYASVRSLGKVR